MPAKRVLHLHLEREWFDDIAEGRKRYEYRAYKEYWRKRLEGKKFDIVRFRNGYAADAPEMDVEFVGLERKGKNYVIRLGDVVKKKRWRPSAANPKFALQLPRVRMRTSGSKRH